MTDRPNHRPESNLGTAAPLVAALLLCVAPAQAGWLPERAGAAAVGVAGAAGVGYAVKENTGELLQHFGTMWDAFRQGNKEKADETWAAVRETPGNIARGFFPVLKVGDAALAAKEGARKTAEGRPAQGGALRGRRRPAGRRRACGARESAQSEREWYESGAGVLAKAPLPTPAAFGAGRSAPAKADPWSGNTGQGAGHRDPWAAAGSGSPAGRARTRRRRSPPMRATAGTTRSPVTRPTTASSRR